MRNRHIPPTEPSPRIPVAVLVISLCVLAWSGVGPHDRGTWWLEVLPALVAMVVLSWTYKRFPMTSLAYVLIGLHAVVLMIGGHYTYAEVPVGNWARDSLHLSRNPYDRLGHFVQGFVPAIVFRELLLRCTALVRGVWLAAIVVSICMAISAVYELAEWLVAVGIGGESSTAFLGTQGDVWDTQKDMGMCLVGATLAIAALSRLHDRGLRALNG